MIRNSQRAPVGSTILLLVRGKLPEHVAQLLKDLPPTHIIQVPPLFLPQPHAELLEGSHAFTRAPSARLATASQFILYGKGPSPNDLYKHQCLSALLPPSHSPHNIAPSYDTITEIGAAHQWFATMPAPSITYKQSDRLTEFCRETASLGAPPKLTPLLRALHIPSQDLENQKQFLYFTWIHDLIKMSAVYQHELHQYCEPRSIPLVPTPMPITSERPTPPIPFQAHPLFNVELSNLPLNAAIKVAQATLRRRAKTIGHTMASHPCGGICVTAHTPNAPCPLPCGHDSLVANRQYCPVCGGCNPIPIKASPTSCIQHILLPTSACAKCTKKQKKTTKRPPRTPREQEKALLESHCNCAPASPMVTVARTPPILTTMPTFSRTEHSRNPLGPIKYGAGTLQNMIGRTISQPFLMPNNKLKTYTGTIMAIETKPTETKAASYRIRYSDLTEASLQQEEVTQFLQPVTPQIPQTGSSRPAATVQRSHPVRAGHGGTQEK